VYSGSIPGRGPSIHIINALAPNYWRGRKKRAAATRSLARATINNKASRLADEKPRALGSADGAFQPSGKGNKRPGPTGLSVGGFRRRNIDSRWVGQEVPPPARARDLAVRTASSKRFELNFTHHALPGSRGAQYFRSLFASRLK